MDSTRWQRIQSLFHDAADLPPSQQRVFLRSACGNDEELLAHVIAMLEEDQQNVSLLDRRLAEVAHETLEEERPAPAPAREFGPYRVLRLLGEGGMGVVYLAERTDLGNQVAVKLLGDSWLSPARRERFSAEQKTLAQLNHPAIARLYDADTLPDGTPWFAMEFVEGVPLTEYCCRHACSVEGRLQLFRQVCEAVQFAHQNAVIHRDLKPSNILVKADGTVKLLDFGIAKQIESLDVSVDQTVTALRLMTPAYAAPEQIRGDRIGIQTDVYSLGVILFELLAKKLPYDLTNLTPAEAASVIVGHEPGKPSTAARTATGQAPSKKAWADLDVLCLTAMHKDRGRRYQSVEAVIRDVDHYLHSEPLEARPDSLRYRVDKFVGRHRPAVLGTGLAMALLLGMAAFFTVRLAKARNAELEEAARTQRVQRFMMNLFQGGDEAAGPSDDLKVITLVDRGVQEAQGLNSDPKVQAELYATLGDIYRKLGNLDRADSLLNRALEQRKALYGPASPEVAESLVALGELRSDQAKLEEAERLVRQGLEIDKRDLPPNHPAIGKATASLGMILENRGNYDQAIQALGEAVRLQSIPGASEADLSTTLSELANSHFYAGNFDISNSINERVLSIDRRIYGERHPQVANDLINLGAIQFEEGHFPEAEKYQRQALDITEGFFGKEHPETASAMTLLARTLVNEKRLDEAADLLRGALAIQEHVYGKVHPRVASALNELGRVAQQQGKLQEARADFQRMTDIYRQVYNGKHYYIGVGLSNLAGVYVDEKNYGEGEQLFREALAMYSETLPPDHQLFGIAHARLGHTLLLAHRYNDAETESRTGFEILSKQSTPSNYWLDKTRSDLAEEYAALHQSEKAEKFRAELAAEKK